MANKGASKIGINGEKLLNAIVSKGYSIRRLAKEPGIERTEKSIRNAIKNNEITAELLFRICYSLELDMNHYIQFTDQYVLYESKEETYRHRLSELLYSILSIFCIPKDRYAGLSDSDRHNLISALEASIVTALNKHFTQTDTLAAITNIGNDLQKFINENQMQIEREIIDCYNREAEYLYQHHLCKQTSAVDYTDIVGKQETSPLL